jgi:hypothetical protein
MIVFWDVAPCSPVKITDVSEVRTASITRVMMKAVSTFEKPVNFYGTTRRNIPERSHLQVYITFYILCFGTVSISCLDAEIEDITQNKSGACDLLQGLKRRVI